MIGDDQTGIANVVDASGLRCPMPLLKAKQCLNTLSLGEVVELKTTDPQSLRDIIAFTNLTNHSLLDHSEEQGVYVFRILKG